MNFDNIDYTRKPASWDEVDTIVPKEMHLAGIATYTTTELGINRPFDNFKIEAPQYFILTNDATGKKYLIDTQGYEYCRYAAEIK